MLYAFSDFTYDDETGLLSQGGTRVPLQRQPSRLLAALLSRPGRVTTRAELARQVWPDDHHVNVDQGLNYCVRQVRRALSDDAARPRFLETVPQVGYRWTAPVERMGLDTPSLMTPLAWWQRPVSVAAAAALSVLCGVLTGTGVLLLSDRGALPIAVVYTPSDHLRQALGALHVLSHAVAEPDRRAEAGPALETLWRVVSSHGADPFDPTGR